MSVDWEFCIVHDEPPNLASDEMLKLLGVLESAGYLDNINFEGFSGDGSTKLKDLDAVAKWLASDPGKWPIVDCDYQLSWGRKAGENAVKYPAFFQLSEDLMDASVVANDSGAASPVYGIKISPGGLAMHMEGYSDDDKFLAEVGNKDSATALLAGLTAALGRPMRMTVLEDIGWMREVPEEEVLARIAEEVNEGLARASDAFKTLVTVLPKPVQRNFDEKAEHPRLDYWQVTEEFEHDGHLCLAAYSPDVTCWYLARPLDKPDATFIGYYPYSFPAFVDTIQRKLDK